VTTHKRNPSTDNISSNSSNTKNKYDHNNQLLSIFTDVMKLGTATDDAKTRPSTDYLGALYPHTILSSAFACSSTLPSTLCSALPPIPELTSNNNNNIPTATGVQSPLTVHLSIQSTQPKYQLRYPSPPMTQSPSLHRAACLIKQYNLRLQCSHILRSNSQVIHHIVIPLHPQQEPFRLPWNLSQQLPLLIIPLVLLPPNLI
jgi:hypothetical protein